MKREYLILAIASGAFLLAAAVPAYLMTRTAKAVQYIADVEGQIGNARSREQSMRSLRQLITDTEQERTTLSQYSVGSDGAASLIELLERDARGLGISFAIGGVSVDPKEGPFDTLKVSMQASGSFSAVMRLLALIETIPYASTVEAITLQREENGQWGGTFSIGVLMRK